MLKVGGVTGLGGEGGGGGEGEGGGGGVALHMWAATAAAKVGGS